MRHTLLAATAALALAAGQAQAAYVINAVESGGNVVMTGSGSLDLSATTPSVTSLALISSTNPSIAVVAIGTGLSDLYFVTLPGLLFGPGASTLASSATGGFLGISAVSGLLVVPAGYQSDTPLGTSTATFTGATFASLGMTPGSYVFSWGDRTANTFDTFTLNIIASPTGVPAPAALSLLGLGLAGLLLARRRG
jgi:hypothetical protein